MGAIVIFLALLGIFRYFKHNIFVAALTTTAVFALILSFGYTFPILYDLFFYNFPMFTSFRAPVMALVLMHFTLPILAGFGLKALCDMAEQYGSLNSLPIIEKRPLFGFFVAIGVFILGGFIFANIFHTNYIADVTISLQQYYNEQVSNHLADFVYQNAVSD
jgi:hypothetical protein